VDQSRGFKGTQFCNYRPRLKIIEDSASPIHARGEEKAYPRRHPKLSSNNDLTFSLHQAVLDNSVMS